jgi:hypothetical protein
MHFLTIYFILLFFFFWEGGQGRTSKLDTRSYYVYLSGYDEILTKCFSSLKISLSSYVRVYIYMYINTLCTHTLTRIYITLCLSNDLSCRRRRVLFGILSICCSTAVVAAAATRQTFLTATAASRRRVRAEMRKVLAVPRDTEIIIILTIRNQSRFRSLHMLSL